MGADRGIIKYISKERKSIRMTQCVLFSFIISASTPSFKWQQIVGC